MRTILCVEDELNILENNRKALEDAGYAVLTAENLKQAREHLAEKTPCAIVLDIMLPDGNGLDFLKELRDADNIIPILMLTAWGKPSDIARGLKLGANDYLSKPFEYEVFLARLEAMLRNFEQLPDTIIKGNFTIKVSTNEVFVNGENLLLAKKEFSLLSFFIQHENSIVSADHIYEKVWGMFMNNSPAALKVMISRLRKKIRSSGYSINTVRNEGYRFEKVRFKKER